MIRSWPPPTPDDIPAGWTVALLSTIPRSGTWFTLHFFEHLNSYLLGGAPIRETDGFHFYDALRLAKFHTHCFCPGFESCYPPERLAEWEALENVSCNVEFLPRYEHVFSPLRNPDVRIVHIYRNPLDQSVSACKQVNNRAPGAVALTPRAHLLERGGLEQYVKQHLSFVHMEGLFPEQIRRIPYERLVQDPAGVLAGILRFWNLSITSEQDLEAVAYALAASSMESLRERERATGRALGGTPLEETGSHIQGGVVGGWRSAFTQADLDEAEERLARFGLSLSGFELR